MPEPGELVKSVNIEDELRQSYLDYAMSVIVGRALPDIRDGLKPVHRRVLYAMSQLNNDWNKPYKKSARVVGDVIGKYHPHGDSSVYEAIVRMAQEFSMRYPLVDGQGNFGSIDGDAPAAMRYTEVRMQRLTHEVLADLDQDTVDFVANYDDTEQVPEVLPSRLPNLLVNGSAGIAVGMATNIPPHNLSEVIAACLALIRNPEITLEELMELLPGPDFPTAGIINGRAGVVNAYRTGRGMIYQRSRAVVEHDERAGRDVIVVTEIPYQVNKARLIQKIADLHKEGRITGISELRDESDQQGLRVVIELKRGVSGEITLNNLYSLTQLESAYGINLVVLIDGKPRLCNLKQIIEAFARHRREVVTRRSIFQLNKAVERAHVLEGMAVALANIDEMIELIKTSADAPAARARLVAKPWRPGEGVLAMLARMGEPLPGIEGEPARSGMRDGFYRLSEAQARAILELRLNRLTALEQDKLFEEYAEKIDQITQLRRILSDPDRLVEVVCEELEELEKQFGDERRTEIQESQLDLEDEDLIPRETRVVTLSHQGYCKSQPLSSYNAQRRGGVGRQAAAVKEEDFIERMVVANTHDTLLCFSSLGKVYWMRVFQAPLGSRSARGRPIVNMLQLEKGERITSMLPLERYPQRDSYLVMSTRGGRIKKTRLEQFARKRRRGLRALSLNEGDFLESVALSNGDDDIMLFTENGRAVRFHEKRLRPMGRAAAGVRGVRLTKGERVVGMIVPRPDGMVLTATRNGYGKRTALSEFPVKGRNIRGVVAMKTSPRNGKLVSAVEVFAGDQCMLISDQGTLVRSGVDEIALVGRNTQGVRIIRLRKGEHLNCAERIEGLEDAADLLQTEALGDEATDGDGLDPPGVLGAGSDEPAN